MMMMMLLQIEYEKELSYKLEQARYKRVRQMQCNHFIALSDSRLIFRL
jgi:hypothetical protein